MTSVGGVVSVATWGRGAGAVDVLGSNALGCDALGNIDVRSVNESLGSLRHSKNPTLCNALFKIIAVKAELMQMKAAQPLHALHGGDRMCTNSVANRNHGIMETFC